MFIYQVNVSFTEVLLDVGLGVGGDVAEAALELARDLMDGSGKSRTSLIKKSHQESEYFRKITFICT